MVGADEAGEKALAAMSRLDDEAVLGPATELEQGWYFPLAETRSARSGVVVNKQTGRALLLTPRSSVSLDPTLYDRGYHFVNYDLVVHAVTDLEATVRVLHGIRCGTQDPYYDDGKVWRSARMLTDAEVRDRLTNLPAVFPCSPSYDLDRLEEARHAGWFTFEALERGSW